jgi:hypothetical protein
LFSVVELWLENKFLLEVLTDPEQHRYFENLTVDRFRTLFALGSPGGTAS